jgi:hypothetical protein
MGQRYRAQSPITRIIASCSDQILECEINRAGLEHKKACTTKHNVVSSLVRIRPDKDSQDIRHHVFSVTRECGRKYLDERESLVCA